MESLSSEKKKSEKDHWNISRNADTYLIVISIELWTVCDENFDVFDKVPLEVGLDLDEMGGDLGGLCL